MLDRPETATQPPRMVRRDRSPVRAAVHADAPDALNGAAVLTILRRRMRLLLASIVLFPLLAYVAIALLTPRYTATGTLLYYASDYKLRELQSILRVDPITDAVMASQAEVLRSIPVVEQVAGRLNLVTNPEFNASLRPPSWLRRMLPAPAPAPVRELPGPTLDPGRNADATNAG